jgi:hypothetical protein
MPTQWVSGCRDGLPKFPVLKSVQIWEMPFSVMVQCGNQQHDEECETPLEKQEKPTNETREEEQTVRRCIVQ